MLAVAIIAPGAQAGMKQEIGALNAFLKQG